jgi:hypothetical protein
MPQGSHSPRNVEAIASSIMNGTRNFVLRDAEGNDIVVTPQDAMGTLASPAA